ncbi:MAG: outer membrane lipoprotein-sorting protein [Desulfobacteraceae bacterium]|nr:hypothetical protein [Desulfobacteraceae bacterium]MBC2755902.1 outer membrane lipoprotein-sorting protein [Desulfobacteraceae bacterium]
MIEKNNLPVRLFINQTVSFFDSGFDSINTEYEQWVRYQIPEEFRSDIDAYDLKRIHIVSSHNSLTVMDGSIVAESEAWMDHYKDIFFYRSRERLVEKLETLGINFSVTSLGRYQGTICYILGAEYQNESVPQLWIAKDTFRPVRWIYEVSDEQGVVEQKEILYSNWKSHYQSWYPSEIEFFQGQNLIQSISVQQIEINPPFSEELFDIEQIKNFYSTEIREEAFPTDQSDIEKRIKEFKKIYE